MEFHLRKLGDFRKIKVLRKPEGCQTKVWVGGRGSACEIFIRSKYASRKHFSITYRDNKFFITDLQSANGTYVNNIKVRGEQLLRIGNVISVGVPCSKKHFKEGSVFIFEMHSMNGVQYKPILVVKNVRARIMCRRQRQRRDPFEREE